MDMDRLRIFLGKPIKLNDNTMLHSPTISEIAEIGEIQYRIYLSLCTFDKEFILKQMLQIVTDEQFKEIEDYNDYEVITESHPISQEIANALSFFCRENINFNFNDKVFQNENGVIISRNNYLDVVKCIKEINGLHEEKKKEMKFRNQKSKEMFSKLNRLRKQHQDESLELKDMLSILCSAEGNGINIFNAGNLTIYQVYEHFERLNINESHKRMIKVWANGLLDKDTKVPEWIVKSKL